MNDLLPGMPNVLERRPTSLGPLCERTSHGWRLNLTDLPLFHGLSVLSRALGELAIEQAQSDRIEIDIHRRIRPRENPELNAQLGLKAVKLTGEHSLLGMLVQCPDTFQDSLRVVFGTLQRPRYRNVLFADTPGLRKALLFRFNSSTDTDDLSALFLLERVPSPKHDQASYLRITVDNPESRRINFDHIPHIAVEDVGRRNFIAGSTRIAQTWAENLRREAERGRRVTTEVRRPHSHLFDQFAKADLGSISQVTFHWTEAMIEQMLESDPAELSQKLKRVLLALEDGFVRQVIENGETVEIICGATSIFIDSSQLGRVLTISLGGRRKRAPLDAYLKAMPALMNVVEDLSARQPLAGTRVMLVHHITAEVLGLIAALRALGCRDLTTVFVAYSNEPPSDYLDALLTLPSTEFRCSALASVPHQGRVEGEYHLSHRYSELPEGPALATMLAANPFRYFEAMRALTVSEFLRLAGKPGSEKLLIIEDGGYLAPAMNDACMRGSTVGEFLNETNAIALFDAKLHSNAALADWLHLKLVGSIEHTRNGLDRLTGVEADHGCLAFPAFSIAISRHKVEIEAREIAMSILNAIEYSLVATGRLLSRRNVVVLGSRGAIGGHIVKSLRARSVNPALQIVGVDLKVETPNQSQLEAASWRDIDESIRRRTDLVIGVTGVSVLSGDDLAEWLCESERDEIVFASGSTKTSEFTDLAVWLDRLLRDESPRINGRPAKITVTELTDAISARCLGHRYTFEIAAVDRLNGADRRRSIVFLANMMPVNFMFYGVATEVIDEVLAQLASCSLGLHERASNGEALPLKLQAVDREIDAVGRPLADLANTASD